MLQFLLSTALLFSAGDDVWDHASVSVYAVHMSSGEVVIDQDSGRSLMPASCMKVVTTAAALHLVDPESHFQTDLEYDGTIDPEGTLHGNLYIRGGGDPCLGSDRIVPSLSWEKQIETWADAVEKLGIRKIEGEIIGDASRWEKALAVPSWCWEDLGNYYGCGASALSFHENYFSLFFRAGNAVGERTTIVRTDPPIFHLTFQNEVTTGSVGSGDRACAYGSEFSLVKDIRGTIPLGSHEFSIKCAIPDPATYCAELLGKVLQARGLSISHRPMVPQNQRVVFHSTVSPSIKEICHWTNQQSINIYAEHLLKKIGEVVVKEGSTQAGTQAVTDFWRSHKINLKGFNMADGSGLSRKNLITTKQLVLMLVMMKNSELFPIFFESLPRQDHSIRAKSGSMSLVRAYAGYAGDIAFAIIVNQCLDAQKMEEKIKLLFSELRQHL